MIQSKNFHKLVQQRQVEIIKACDPARRLVGKIFRTFPEPIQKVYSNPVFLFEDESYIYKVFYRDQKFNGLHFKNDQHTVSMYVKFFQNYDGDMQMQDYYHGDDCSIIQLVKLPGQTLTDIKNNTGLTIEQAGKWFAEQCGQIHETGMRCVRKHKEFEMQRHIFGSGYYFIFSDWSPDNILYDQKTNKLYLVDLQPVNWLPDDLWHCVVRSQWRDISRLNWKLPRRQINENKLSGIENDIFNLVKESFGEKYFPKKLS